MTPTQKVEDTAVATTVATKPKKEKKEAAKKIEKQFVIAKSAKRTELEKIVHEYAKGYPGNKVFHICSDHMVFLENDLTEAKNHQSIIGGEVESITIE